MASGSASGWPGRIRWCWPGYAPGVSATRPLGKEIDRLVADAAAPSPSLMVTRGGRLVAVTGVSDGGEAGRVAGRWPGPSPAGTGAAR